MKRLAVLYFLFFTVFCSFPSANGKLVNFAEPEKLLANRKAPWTLRANKIEYDREKMEYVATGNVVIRSDGKLIQADYARFNKKSGLVELKGNVFIKLDGDWARGEEVRWNLEEETGFIRKGLVYFAKNHFFIHADYMEKRTGNVFYLENGYITTCTPKRPDWKIDYKSLLVPLNGFAQAKGIIFKVGSVPVIYLPWGMFPIQQERQSGFLTPAVGLSELQGFEMEIPYFWAIDRSKDLTMFGHYFQKRGLMVGTEFRWSTLDWGEGIIIANYLHDNADKDHLNSQGVPFETRDRYWIRGLISANLKNGVALRSKIDLISDRNFLKEFEKGSPSYDYTDKAFRSFLATGVLQDKTMSARESNIYLMKLWDNTELSLDVHYWDEENPYLNDFTLQTLPDLKINVAQTNIDNTSLFYQVNSSISNFWRERGVSGTRLKVAPGILKPFHFPYANITSEISLDTAMYHLYQTEDTLDSFEYRVVPIFKLSADTQFERVYRFDLWNVTAIKHAIRPEIAYEYTPDIDQSDIPRFDVQDVVPERNRIRYGFTTFTTVKKSFGSGNGSTATTYEEWLRLKVFQYYQFSEQPMDIPEDPLSYDFFWKTEDKGFSDVYLELDITPHRFVELSYDLTVSPDEDFVRRHDASLMVNMPSGQMIRLDYRYREETTTDEFIADFSWNVTPWLTLSTYHDYSFDKGEMFKQGYGITYRRNCWAISLSYEKEGSDRRFFVGLNLLGLGQTSLGYSNLSGTEISR